MVKKEESFTNKQLNKKFQRKTCKNYTFERPCQIGKANSLSSGFKIQFHSDTVIINGLSNKAQNKNRAKSFIL